MKILARPFQRNVLLDSGESWKLTEEVIDYLKEKDAAINRKVLIQSATVLDEVYVKPFQTERSKVRVPR